MILPDTNMINIFNKVLISLSDLSPDGSPCSIDSLINQCKSVVFGGQIVDYDVILSHCKNCSLIQIKNKMVSISALGQKFLDSNRERYFEINEAQKYLISERVVFKGSWSYFAHNLFEFFYPNFEKETYELSIEDKPLPIEHNSTLHLFKYLGILQSNESVMWVDKKYSELVYQLTADSKAISEQQLEKILMENRKLGSKAENVMVEFEKQRLQKIGKHFQADLVRRISTINTAAGYDIESFDGTTDDLTPNRFIEVKATKSSEFRFYWTLNEIKVAKKKKDSYWIYLLREFNEDKPKSSYPIMVRNPEHTIKNHSCLKMEAHKYLIYEISVLNLQKRNIEDINWYELY